MYDLLNNYGVARFYYKGNSHSHPVRRTVRLIKTTKDYLTGYEIREGETVRELEESPIKTYRRSRIPKWGDYWRLRRYGNDPAESTLVRCSTRHLAKHGA